MGHCVCSGIDEDGDVQGENGDVQGEKVGVLPLIMLLHMM